MGLGNSFEQIDKNIEQKYKDYEERIIREKKENPFVVSQISIEKENRFSSLELASKYLKKAILEEFEVYSDKGETFEIELSFVLKKEKR